MIDTKLQKSKDCTGCYACASICPVGCISMPSDEEGFWYPRTDMAKCIKCERCIVVCPIVNKVTINNTPVAYACMNKDEFVRLESSSGGIFTAIAEMIIDDGGVVFGASFNKNFELEHCYVEAKEELNKLRGSKYIQSKIGESYRHVKELLASEQTVLFTGTPCQISGLKAYLGQDKDKLICLDIVCHGVPSPDVWRKYVEYREAKSSSEIKSFEFRRKNRGWRQYSVMAVFANNTQYQEIFDNDLYMQSFLNNVCLRPSCYNCHFKKLHRESDMTLADFWGVENILPEMDDDKGTSLIFVNNSHGKLLLDKLVERINYQEVNIFEAIKYNTSVLKSVGYNANRVEFFRDKNHLSFDKLVKKYCKIPLRLRIKKKLFSLTTKLFAPGLSSEK